MNDELNDLARVCQDMLADVEVMTRQLNAAKASLLAAKLAVVQDGCVAAEAHIDAALREVEKTIGGSDGR